MDQVLMFFKQFCGAQQHGGMHVMATAVHSAVYAFKV